MRCNRTAYRERNAVERLIRRVNRHRATATAYEKLQETDRALLTIACILLLL